MQSTTFKQITKQHDNYMDKLQELEKRIKALETDKIGVIMTYNSDTNLFRSVQRTLSGNTNLGTGSFSMGNNVPTANQSAIVDLSSTTKGFLPPRMTTTQRDAITTPAEGLVIYNTTTKLLNFYNGTLWTEVVTSFNTPVGDVTISAGANITLTPSGNDIAISTP